MSSIRMDPFLLQNDRGWPVRGDVWRSESLQGPLALVSHGFKGFKDWGFFPYLSRSLAAAGFTAVAFNFSGNGIGEDPDRFTEPDRFRRNSLAREIADLDLVLQAALRGDLPGLKSPSKTAALLGHSRGGLVSLVTAKRAPEVARVVTWASIGSLEKRYDIATRADWRRRGFLEVMNARTGQVFQIGVEALDDLESHFAEYDPLSVVTGLRKPLLMIHGTEDATIPVEEARELWRCADHGKSRFVEIAGAGHTFEAVHPFHGPTPALETALRETISFLREGTV